MFVLRCTQRLLARVKVATELAPPSSTTRLGDWYANLVHIQRRQLILAVSEQTLLPVLIPAAPIASLVPRLRAGITEVLQQLGLPKIDVDRESVQMEAVVFARTANRQVTGVMVDFAKALEFYVQDGASLAETSLQLAHTPCSPLYETTITPERATVALLHGPTLRGVR